VSDISEAVPRLAREESAQVLALLSRRFGLDVADDAVQDALVESLNWAAISDNPAAGLYTVARNRAVNRVRRDAAAAWRARRAISARGPQLSSSEVVCTTAMVFSGLCRRV
jgi:RNA polymerase sigma-70 factor (ECF subfamily)